MDAAHIYTDVAASGAKDYNSRDQWHVLNQQLAQGGVLVVADIDRLGRRYLETMWAIYDLQRRGIRLRSLAGNEVEWTKYLDADPDSPEAFMGNVLVSMAAYLVSKERQNISRRTRKTPRADTYQLRLALAWERLSAEAWNRSSTGIGSHRTFSTTSGKNDRDAVCLLWLFLGGPEGAIADPA